MAKLKSHSIIGEGCTEVDNVQSTMPGIIELELFFGRAPVDLRGKMFNQTTKEIAKQYVKDSTFLDEEAEICNKTFGTQYHPLKMSLGYKPSIYPELFILQVSYGARVCINVACNIPSTNTCTTIPIWFNSTLGVINSGSVTVDVPSTGSIPGGEINIGWSSDGTISVGGPFDSQSSSGGGIMNLDGTANKGWHWDAYSTGAVEIIPGCIACGYSAQAHFRFSGIPCTDGEDIGGPPEEWL